MTPKKQSVIEHTAFAQRVDRGWIGVYTFPRDGVACTEHVKRAGLPRVFRSEIEAKAEAGVALCRALNAGTRPRRLGAVFNIRHHGGRAHIVAEAQRHFTIGAAR